MGHTGWCAESIVLTGRVFNSGEVGGNYRDKCTSVVWFIVVSWGYHRADGSHGSAATSRGEHSGAGL